MLRISQVHPVSRSAFPLKPDIHVLTHGKNNGKGYIGYQISLLFKVNMTTYIYDDDDDDGGRISKKILNIVLGYTHCYSAIAMRKWLVWTFLMGSYIVIIWIFDEVCANHTHQSSMIVKILRVCTVKKSIKVNGSIIL